MNPLDSLVPPQAITFCKVRFRYYFLKPECFCPKSPLIEYPTASRGC